MPLYNYSVANPPTLGGQEKVLEWIFEEFQKLEGASFTDLINLQQRHVEPGRPRDGDVVLADGIDWDPGAGEGFYGYYNATWNKLG